MGHAGGQVVSMFAFYSDDPNLNPAEKTQSLFCKLFQKERKEAGDGPLKQFYNIVPTLGPTL